MSERLKGSFETHGEGVAAGKYGFVYGVIKKPADIAVEMYEVDTEADLEQPGVNLTVAQAYSRFGGLMLDLPALEVYGAVHADDHADWPVVVVWNDGTKFWVGIRGDKPGQRYLFVGTRSEDEVLPGTCTYLVRKPTHE